MNNNVRDFIYVVICTIAFIILCGIAESNVLQGM